MDITTDAKLQKAHFHRRASFGATLAELNSGTKNHELLEQWLQTQPSIDVPGLGAVVKGKGRGDQALKFGDWLLTQMVTASNPLHEKITNFWRDHFVIGIKKIRFPQLLTDYETRLRTYALGDF